MKLMLIVAGPIQTVRLWIWIKRLTMSIRWLLITTACWFHALFYADTLGFVHDTLHVYWVMVWMALMPLALYLLERFVVYAWQRSSAVNV